MNHLVKLNKDYINELIDIICPVIYDTFYGFFKESIKFKNQSKIFLFFLIILKWDKNLNEIFINIQIYKCSIIDKLITRF